MSNLLSAVAVYALAVDAAAAIAAMGLYFGLAAALFLAITLSAIAVGAIQQTLP